MIGIMISAMMWTPAETGINFPISIPRSKQEMKDAQKMQLRSRFKLRKIMAFAPDTPPKLTYQEAPLSLQELIANSKRENFTHATEPQQVLVIAPHPDDEILCCATTIAKHIENGDAVSLVVITDGDGKEQGDARLSLDYGKVRRQESLSAAQNLGIDLEQVMFLGFPDGHLSDLEKKGRTRSKFTSLMQTLRNSLFPGTSYTWGGLQDSLRKVLDNTQPTIIYFPGEHDTHPDHQATSRAIKQALAGLEEKPIMNKYSVHFKTNYPANEPLNYAKLALIREFSSQRHDIKHIKYLDEFAKRKESFK